MDTSNASQQEEVTDLREDMEQEEQDEQDEGSDDHQSRSVFDEKERHFPLFFLTDVPDDVRLHLVMLLMHLLIAATVFRGVLQWYRSW